MEKNRTEVRKISHIKKIFEKIMRDYFTMCHSINGLTL